MCDWFQLTPVCFYGVCNCNNCFLGTGNSWCQRRNPGYGYLYLTKRQQTRHNVVFIYLYIYSNLICNSLNIFQLSITSSFLYLYPRPTKLEGEGGGILDSPCPSARPSVCPSVRPSVCRRRGYRSISQVSFGISISNFICILMVAIGRNLLIFNDITIKMAAWRPYWIFWFPDSNFTLALNINYKLQRHNTNGYR